MNSWRHFQGLAHREGRWNCFAGNCYCAKDQTISDICRLLADICLWKLHNIDPSSRGNFKKGSLSTSYRDLMYEKNSIGSTCFFQAPFLDHLWQDLFHLHISSVHFDSWKAIPRHISTKENFKILPFLAIWSIN